MTVGKIVRKPWKRELCGLSDMAEWVGGDPSIKRGPGGKASSGTIGYDLAAYTDLQPLDHSNMGNIYRWSEAEAALRAIGYTEGGGRLERGGRTSVRVRDAADA